MAPGLLLAIGAMANLLLPLNAEPKYTIAYSRFAPLNSDIFVADADGRNPKPFLASPGQDFNASFSKDGKWILFTSDRQGSADIYRAHRMAQGWNGSPTIPRSMTRLRSLLTGVP